MFSAVWEHENSARPSVMTPKAERFLSSDCTYGPSMPKSFAEFSDDFLGFRPPAM
ncbi:hypothetical protein Mal52_57410 [Symmachiella dynata]|uniref:Uncharacterized protein n=1 Tax=Symmachiella dynata TaxID=2527995 RepID=A0A517ZXK2_9PLAN|nr:hypothetical protein Mal52_57410 [Symmachiella dynata]